MAEEIATIERRTPNAEPHTLPVRIAHVIGKMRNGGVEAAVLGYYKHIDRTKIQYDFLIDEDSTDIPAKFIEELGGRVIIIPPYQKQFAYQKALYNIFTTNKYPLVYSHINTLSVFPLFAAWRAGVPVRVALSQSTAGKGEFKRNVMKYILRMFSRTFATKWCACSRLAGAFQFGKRAMDSGRVQVWPNAIDLPRYAYSPEIRTQVRKLLNLEGKFVVGHAGRFMNQKNHAFLIDVFAELHRKRGDSVLLLAGDGPLMNDVKAKVSGLGLEECVIFLGSVHDMERYYQAMDVFVFPSFYEGLPVVGSEVQVSGLPFLCADTVTPETKFCENLHFMSLKKSAREWADEALKISHGHVRRDMTQSARDAGFDIRQQAQKLTQWYCNLLGL